MNDEQILNKGGSEEDIKESLERILAGYKDLTPQELQNLQNQ
jgi:hypothetical protein